MRRLWIGVVVVIVLAGAAVADRLEPPKSPLPSTDPVDGPGGVWACPVVKGAGSAGWLHLVNTGRDAAQIRISFLPDGRKPIEQSLALGAGRAGTVGTPASIGRDAAGAIVEYAGGEVTVSRTVLLSVHGATGAAAASCARPGTETLVISQGATLRAETQIALLNPTTADALVDVALLVEGQKLEPESLQRRIVPARGRLVLREGDFAFDEPAIAALVVARTGRVVADGVLLAAGLLDIVPAQTVGGELVAVASTARGGVQFAAVAVGDEDAVTQGLFQSTAGQTTFAALTTGIRPNTPTVTAPPAGDTPTGPVALSVRSTTSSIALGARWQVVARSGPIETATSTGVSPARGAVVVLGPPAPSSGMRLLVANPDPEDAFLNVALFTGAGRSAPAPLQGLRLGGGRTTTITLPGSPPDATVGVAVASRGGRIVAALEAVLTLPNLFAAYAVTAVPMSTVPLVAIEPDARQGVPAS